MLALPTGSSSVKLKGKVPSRLPSIMGTPKDEHPINVLMEGLCQTFLIYFLREKKSVN